MQTASKVSSFYSNCHRQMKSTLDTAQRIANALPIPPHFSQPDNCRAKCSVYIWETDYEAVWHYIKKKATRIGKLVNPS